MKGHGMNIIDNLKAFYSKVWGDQPTAPPSPPKYSERDIARIIAENIEQAREQRIALGWILSGTDPNYRLSREGSVIRLICMSEYLGGYDMQLEGVDPIDLCLIFEECLALDQAKKAEIEAAGKRVVDAIALINERNPKPARDKNSSDIGTLRG